MNNFYEYLIRVSAIIIIFYIPYYLLFSQTTFFRLNRFFLLGSVLVSFIIPILNLSFAGENLVLDMPNMIDGISISSIGDNNIESNHSLVSNILTTIYLSGTFIFISFLMFRIFQLFRIIRRHKVKRSNRIKMITVDNDMAPSSFFNYVFLSDNDSFDEILEHEKVHIKQKHSIDILFMEIAKIILWFHPVIWMYSKSIRNLHEYMADEETLLKGYDRLQYQYLVFENSFGARLNLLAVNFNFSPLKKRLKMMTINKSKNRKKWIYLLILPVFLMTIAYYGCEQNSVSEDIEYNEQGDIVRKGDIYFMVDKMPDYPGGFEMVKKDIATTLRYPSVAKSQGITGRIFVQFNVDTDGKIVDINIVRTTANKKDENNEVVVVGYRSDGELLADKDEAIDALEKEAVRAVKSLKTFTPGVYKDKKVKVSFTFPINFTLTDKPQ